MNNEKIEVMRFLAKSMDSIIENFLNSIETNWQPSDLLPTNNTENFEKEIRELREECKALPYEYLAVLIGDLITEEALPTYQSWLLNIDGISQLEPGGWSKWVRMWSAEENRHGDLLNKYLYLGGRVNMRQMETSTQYLIADGFDIGTGTDPYKNFIYTSFQELATNLSHRRTATLAKKYGNNSLAKICGVIAADEARHASAYKSFVSRIFEIDPSEMMLAFETMMRNKIVMPAHFIRQSGEKISETFSHFSDAAQRLGVYTSLDYANILASLISDWSIETMTGLNEKGEMARDYLMALPDRFRKISGRKTKAPIPYQFSWIN